MKKESDFLAYPLDKKIPGKRFFRVLFKKINLFGYLYRFLTREIDMPCLSYRDDYGPGGYDYDCAYECGDVYCDNCVCNFGYYNPETGKKINFFLRKIQDKRGLKYYLRNKAAENKNNERIKAEDNF